MPLLDERLSLIADMVRTGSVAVDIGTDHGRLMAHLILSGKIPRGYATDVNAMPLQKAIDLMASHNISSRVTPILCDGLDGFEQNSVDDVIIAGMGAELIVDILSSWPHTKSPEKRYILQPMTRPEKLRDYLYREGFMMECEQGVSAAGRVYSIMVASYTGQCHSPDDLELYLGGISDLSLPDNMAYAKRLLLRTKRKADGIATTGANALRWRNLEAQIFKVIGKFEPQK